MNKTTIGMMALFVLLTINLIVGLSVGADDASSSIAMPKYQLVNSPSATSSYLVFNMQTGDLFEYTETAVADRNGRYKSGGWACHQIFSGPPKEKD